LYYGDNLVDLLQVPSLYSRVKNHLSDVMAKEYESYYTDFEFVLYDYKESITASEFAAIFYLEWTTKEMNSTYMQLQAKGKLLANGSLDEKSLVIMTFNDGTNKYDIPLADFFPRNN
jgi:hypothetical protein